ncbi:hypothetical protein HS048_31585 [Planomonospora sp. ID91781]|uniref:hypothetical protein n=1 Tax=Planomonospora sp. ID91781 TaxID=2738135 RepID=UPI0018C3B883|nr:hypothetical protein [Planomonospora sp. ID91781]MBG0825234.1 hypothetical protein [Planomonospora sp. ID91781]
MATTDVVIIRAFVIAAVIVIAALGFRYNRSSQRPRLRRTPPPLPHDPDGSDGGGCGDGGE